MTEENFYTVRACKAQEDYCKREHLPYFAPPVAYAQDAIK